MVMEMESELEA